MHNVRPIKDLKNDLKNDSFKLNEWSRLADLALLSLRIGLRSYFETYTACGHAYTGQYKALSP